eukprot:NODE_286_length_10728_cov_0.553298.p8 type:complete len:196 gc:universal NODE_286_length_10728_cov_0.553298:10486-9899(-)
MQSRTLSPFKKKIIDENVDPEHRLLSRPITDKPKQVSLSVFVLLYSEIIRYHQDRVKGIQDLESKLHDIGYQIGQRIYEVLVYVNKFKRDNNILTLLSFLHGTLWQYLFQKKADALEKSSEHSDEYMISDNNLVISKFISPPKEMSSFSSGALVAGIIESFCDQARFPARVTAHNVPIEGFPQRCTILIKLLPNP